MFRLSPHRTSPWTSASTTSTTRTVREEHVARILVSAARGPLFASTRGVWSAALPAPAEDKRLDEWVQLSAIVAAWEGPAAGPSSSSSSAAAAAASAASAPRARKRRQSKVRAEGKFEAMEREHQEATRVSRRRGHARYRHNS